MNFVSVIGIATKINVNTLCKYFTSASYIGVRMLRGLLIEILTNGIYNYFAITFYNAVLHSPLNPRWVLSGPINWDDQGCLTLRNSVSAESLECTLFDTTGDLQDYVMCLFPN